MNLHIKSTVYLIFYYFNFISINFVLRYVCGVGKVKELTERTEIVISSFLGAGNNFHREILY